MSRAYRCEVCDEMPWWQIKRRGDVAVSWACTLHLHDVCVRMQRVLDNPTELVVTEAALP